MDRDFMKSSINESIENITLFSKRLILMLNHIQFKNINLIERIILCNYIEEISYNTKTFDIYYEIKEDHKNQVLGDGEASSIAIAIKNNGIIAYSNPDAIKDYLEKYNLKCITVEDILKDLLKKGIISQEEFETLLK